MAQRTISVSGNSEMEIIPDIIEFTVSMKEYWKEEFETGKKYEDYVTKVPMSDIEPIVLNQLLHAGVNEEQIKVSAIGNYQRQTGKEFLVSKTLIITVGAFEIVNEITRSITDKGINNMFISDLRHSKIEEYEKSIRINALKDARIKADYLLNSIEEKCGKVLSISEINVAHDAPVFANGMLRASTDYSNSSSTELRKIIKRYSINATFAIVK